MNVIEMANKMVAEKGNGSGKSSDYWNGFQCGALMQKDEDYCDLRDAVVSRILKGAKVEDGRIKIVLEEGATMPAYAHEEDAKKQADNAEKEESERISRLKRAAFAEQTMLDYTFARDDRANPKISAALRTYCDNFPRFRREGKGIILYGSVGTGKSFLAACVVNELVSKGYACQMTTFSRLTNQIGAIWNGKQEYIDQIARLSLIAIDDLGVERDTEYMNENITTILDSLYAAKVPMIITSNYSPKQMTAETDIRRKRIFDRILERCHPIEMTGESRRKKIGRNDYLEMKAILGV